MTTFLGPDEATNVDLADSATGATKTASLGQSGVAVFLHELCHVVRSARPQGAHSIERVGIADVSWGT